MEILAFPNKKLFQPTKEVTVFGPELLVLLEAMHNAMVSANGIGLAANQVGLDYKMFVMRSEDDKQKFFLVNPTILKRSDALANRKEGCLSAPGEFITLSDRRKWVLVTFQDPAGKIRRHVFEDLLAVCVQHEMDHLDGQDRKSV